MKLKRTTKHYKNLTPQEKTQVWIYLSKGYGLKDISRDTGIGYHTLCKVIKERIKNV
tara:strand:- start:13196 stop:13366 length:171 start_codon:yes stop_codon:yes gene_type:complete